MTPGNVMDYLDVDPISDIQKCAEEIRSFCIKDHRNFPRGRGLRARIRGDRSLQAASYRGLHGSEDAALAVRISSHLRFRAPQIQPAWMPWRVGPGVLEIVIPALQA